MTKTEAQAELERLRDELCTCGVESLKVADHNSKCKYRIPAWSQKTLRPFTGGLYCVADPEPVAA